MLSPNDKIFLGKEIFEDCEIFIIKFVDRDVQQYFKACISSKVSKLPERYQDIKTWPHVTWDVRKMIEKGDIYGYHYRFSLICVSQVFTLWCMVSYSNFY